MAEKRGKVWALTSFMREAWDSAKEEIARDGSHFKERRKDGRKEKNP